MIATYIATCTNGEETMNKQQMLTLKIDAREAGHTHTTCLHKYILKPYNINFIKLAILLYLSLII